MDPRWQALAVLTAARTSLGFQFQSLASVSPLLVEELGLTYADLGFLIGLYFLPGVVVALPGGALGRRYGDKRVVLIGLTLMALGGVVTSLAQGFAGLAAGRVLSGAGAVLLNVLMAKMVTDWFAGREIVLAMAVFVNSFPIGVGLAVLSLGWLAEAAGWATALSAPAVLALAALFLLAAAYAKHPNDRAGATGLPTGGARISAGEVALVSVAGTIWGLFNGAFAVMFGFAPTFLTGEGYTAAAGGLIAATATWLVVASTLAGGTIVQRWGRPVLLMVVGVVAWGLCLLVIASGQGSPATALILAGALMGLPIGVIMSLPAQALRPENRAFGLGLFYVWLYIGHSGLPPAAGWLQDRTGSAAAPLYFAAVLVLSMLPLFAAFHMRLAARTRATSGASDTRTETASR